MTAPEEDLVPAIIRVLKANGYGAYEDWGPSPAMIMVRNDNEVFSFCHSFNREDSGWEAQLDQDEGKVFCLVDGPGIDASANEVTAWMLEVLQNPEPA